MYVAAGNSGPASSGAPGVQRGTLFAGAALGPILSGAITTFLSWRIVFGFDAVIGAIVTVGATVATRDVAAERRRNVNRTRSVDIGGFVLSVVGAFFLIYALVEGARVGWGSKSIVGSLAAAVVAILFFLLVESRSKAPLVDLSLFRDRLFGVGNFARGTTEFASLAVFFALSHYLQVQLGYPPFIAGALLMAIILGAVVAAPIAEALVKRADVRLFVVPGFLLVGVGAYWLSHITTATRWLFFIAPLLVADLGFGLLETPTEYAMNLRISPAKSGEADRLSYAIYLFGIGLGVAVVSGAWQTAAIVDVRSAAFTAKLGPSTVRSLMPTVLQGGIEGSSSSGMAPVPGKLHGMVQSAFAHSVDTALLVCVAVALIGALVSLFFVEVPQGRGARGRG